ncbi:hypothetical protein ACN38_g6034 [Penicillium nordicum]|uniref:Uncharacterized protein n=1 Tax=Penicillium nordicum TaxID=229535 RepID=A0A0M8P9C6_9EURO|nr:hypothetical protein ACN38_g6034 [Penicillium nordicum]
MTMDKPFGSLDGAPIVTKFAITETEKLAEIIEQYKLNNRPVPEYCIEDIKQLASLLQQSQPDDNLQLSLNHGLDPEEIVNNNLEIAWYLSAWLYFYNRLAKFSDDDAPLSMFPSLSMRS